MLQAARAVADARRAAYLAQVTPVQTPARAQTRALTPAATHSAVQKQPPAPSPAVPPLPLPLPMSHASPFAPGSGRLASQGASAADAFAVANVAAAAGAAAAADSWAALDRSVERSLAHALDEVATAPGDGGADISAGGLSGLKMSLLGLNLPPELVSQLR
jgi:hypothetical protein